MNKGIKIILFINILFLISLSILNAKVPQLINYQGKVTDNGTPVNGYHSILFKIYDSEVSGTLIWQSEVETVYITNGIFSAYIGKTTDGTSPTAFSNIDWGTGDKYLEITLDTEVLSPRERFTSVPFALYALRARHGVPAGVIVIWSGSIVNIPDGWALCDGSNGTPDLRDRFIVGAGSSYSVGATGGSISHTHGVGSYAVGNHTLTIAEMPAHTHTYYAVVNDESAKSWYESGGSWPNAKTTSSTGGNQPHNHPFTGISGSADSRPPYYALAYIMKLP